VISFFARGSAHPSAFAGFRLKVFDLLGEPLALLRRSAKLTKPAQAVEESVHVLESGITLLPPTIREQPL
jgi:hypothetical protein